MGIWMAVMSKMEWMCKGECVGYKISTGLVCEKEHFNNTTNNALDCSQNHTLTMLAPLVIITVGNWWLPIWPVLPSTCGIDLPSFCLATYYTTIKNEFVTHFHQHVEIPVGSRGTYSPYCNWNTQGCGVWHVYILSEVWPVTSLGILVELLVFAETVASVGMIGCSRNTMPKNNNGQQSAVEGH